MKECMIGGNQIDAIIFDLSEVLIRGLFGIEIVLAQELNTSPSRILPAFAGPEQRALFEGRISEHEYLDRLIRTQEWSINREQLKRIVRDNFQHEVDGMADLLACLAAHGFRLVLLSDHAREWIEYIEATHPFLQIFHQTFYSFVLRSTKKNQWTFRVVVETLSATADRCLFIDDNPANVATAGSAGMQGILFSDALQLRATLEPFTGKLSCEE